MNNKTTYFPCADRSNVEQSRSLALRKENMTLSSLDNSTALENTTIVTSVNDTTTSFQNVSSIYDITQWSTQDCIIVYCCILAAIVVLVFGSSLFFFTVCMRASVRLHDSMFNSITRATMWFFNNNPSGNSFI